ncbi:MAG: methionyl-tRNA formyltransferase [Actinomycetaceae bacterium]|nr:methionyl-tRNA formyltransferase [Actinomycetaceae bacterium]
MKILFAGTPDVAIPTLAALNESNHEVVAVLTRTPARRGRGRTLYPSDVSAWATENGIRVIEADSLKDPEVAKQIVETGAQIGVVVAYGALIPQSVLDSLEYGWINLHFSPLPRWRGAAPVQRAIEAGDTVTAVDIFQLEAGLDTGPVYSTRTVEIDENINAGDLLDELATIGAADVVDVVDALELGVARAVPQDEEGATYAHMIKREDLAIDFSRPARSVHNQVRATAPSPGAYTTLPDGKRLKVLQTRVTDAPATKPGALTVEKNAVFVSAADLQLELLLVAPAGKSHMRAADWARGARLSEGSVLGGNGNE